MILSRALTLDETIASTLKEDLLLVPLPHPGCNTNDPQEQSADGGAPRKKVQEEGGL